MNFLKDIFTYPFRGSGKYLLIGCAIMSIISELSSYVPILGGLTYLILAGYFCAVYFQLMQSSASGSDEASDFPSTTHLWTEIMWPMLQILIILLASFSPVIIYGFCSDELSDLIMISLIALGIIYTPMAILSVNILGYLGAMSPHIVLPAIIRAGRLYWLGIITLFLLYGVEFALFCLLENVPVLNTLVMAVIGSYVIITNARTLGLIYRLKAYELGWV